MAAGCEDLFPKDPTRLYLCQSADREMDRLRSARLYGIGATVVVGLSFSIYLLLVVHFVPALFAVLFLLPTWLALDSYFVQGLSWCQQEKRVMLIPKLSYEALMERLTKIDSARAKRGNKVFFAWFPKVLSWLGRLLKKTDSGPEE